MFLDFAKKKEIPLMIVPVVFEESIETVELRHPNIERKCVDKICQNCMA